MNYKNIKNILFSAICLITPCIQPEVTLQFLDNDSAQATFLGINAEKILVDITQQKLFFANAKNKVTKTYIVSTGKNGSGEQPGSFKTPRGLFTIDGKIGDHNDPMVQYKARVPVGKYNPATANKDNILSRILTLDGQQEHNKNTLQRYVYIHGTSATKRLGTQPCSLGCIRMDPHEIISLFDQVRPGTAVYVHDSGNPLKCEQNSALFIGGNQMICCSHTFRNKGTTSA